MNAWNILWEQRDALMTGFNTTIGLFVLSSVLAALSGAAAVCLLEGKANPARRTLRAAMDTMRMLPFLIYAYLLYYGLPELGIRLDAWTAGLIALATYHAAYLAEILRGARAALPRGQTEAAAAHGMTRFQLMRRVVLPQLFLRSGPLLGNQLIICLKDSAFLTIITVKELTGAATAVQSTFFIPVQALLLALVAYWGVSLMVDRLASKISHAAVKRGLGYSHATARS